MKKINGFHTVYGSLFWSDDLKFMHYIHENDAFWSEYLDPILSYCGGKIIFTDDHNLVPIEVMEYLQSKDDTLFEELWDE